MVHIVIKLIEVVFAQVGMHVRSDTNKEDQCHCNPKRAVQIRPLKSIRSAGSNYIVAKVLGLVKVKNDSLHASQNIFRLNVEIGFVSFQGKASHAVSPPRTGRHRLHTELRLLLGRHIIHGARWRSKVRLDGRLLRKVILDRRLRGERVALWLKLLLLLKLRLLLLLKLLLRWGLLGCCVEEDIATATSSGSERIIVEAVVVCH
mmetsp:Transcript_75923/g.114337  ORF Transcript_75923/g.114337 Transcript_75923/m.114337 type:complete len:204 (-) Transcript_75923:94-705(-)